MKSVIKDPFIDGFIAQGEAMGEARLLLRYLNARFTVPAAIRERVTGCADVLQLEAWFDRALSAPTLEEVFAL